MGCRLLPIFINEVNMTKKASVKKYTNAANKKFKPQMQTDGSYKPDTFPTAQLALTKAEFARKDREQFFDDAYGEIMLELFEAWIQTEPHCTKEREYLYHVALGLGSVKERLVRIETFGFNSQFLSESQLNEENIDE